MGDENIHRLSGSGRTSGGLLMRKKKPDDHEEFKVPKMSLLGLDKLAAIKEKEKREIEEKAEISAKKFKPLDTGNSSAPDDRRQFRKHSDETPTHTGGVPKEVYDKRKERERREKERGIHVKSKESKNGTDRERDRRDRHDRSQRGHKDRHERSRGSERHHREFSSSRSARDKDSGWDFDTPR